MYEEFEAIPNDPDDATWQKYLGAGAKTKIRALSDLLKMVSNHVDQQVDVNDFNVVVKDKKRLQAIFTVTNAWLKSGGGSNDSFATAFKEVLVFV